MATQKKKKKNWSAKKKKKITPEYLENYTKTTKTKKWEQGTNEWKKKKKKRKKTQLNTAATCKHADVNLFNRMHVDDVFFFFTTQYNTATIPFHSKPSWRKNQQQQQNKERKKKHNHYNKM